MSTSRLVRVVVGTVTFTVPVTLTVLDVFGYVAKVEGVSMQPSLNPETYGPCDYVFLNKWAIRHHQYQRGEVISLISPTNASQRLIKRIIALEGDTVKTLHYKKRYVKIPDGHCWVEGDHHGHSLDSNLFGPVSVSLIQAKASRIVWPPVRWRPLEADPTFLERRVNPLVDPPPSDKFGKCVLAKDSDSEFDPANHQTAPSPSLDKSSNNVVKTDIVQDVSTSDSSPDDGRGSLRRQ